MQLAQTGEALGASYRFVKRVGAGAVGEVWTVTSADGKTFAAKVLRPEHANDPSLVERFVRERSVLLGLADPHIVTVRDMVVEGARLAIVMDYIAGGSLGEVVKGNGPLRPVDALNLTAEVFDALAAAHARGVTHRDIKPDNVLLVREWSAYEPGDVRVSDFGIAGVVGEGNHQSTGLMGTPLYMPPELISQGDSGPAGDVYSTGILLYELLAGRTPFAGPGTDFSIAYRHVSSLPPRIPVADGVWEILARLLSKDAAKRPTAGEAAAIIRQLVPGLAGSATLVLAEAPAEFADAARPATVLRSAFTDEERAIFAPATPTDQDVSAPELGPAGSATIARPMPRRDVRPAAAAPAQEGLLVPFWRTRKALILAGSGVLLITAVVVGLVLLVPGKQKDGPKASGEQVSTQLQDTALPTGLTISRAAAYDPSSGQVRLTLSYAAQKAPLSGDFLEVIPGLNNEDVCPAVTWSEASASRNQASISGLDVACGWKITGLKVPAGGSVTATATVTVSPADQQGIDVWLRGVSSATTDAVQDTTVKGMAYPVQRLQSVEVRTPTRVVTPSPLKITLVPVWASGADELNPLYVSPASGKPSQMLEAVAGGESGLRFSDGCGGALAVDSSGLTVTALQISPQCTVRASVGNFTELHSPNFGITSRENFTG